MQGNYWRKLAGLLPLAVLAALPLCAYAQQTQTSDPVADAARKAREQKKAEPKAKKVFTDDDVKPAQPATEATPASGSTAQGAEGQQAGGDNAKASAKDDPNGEAAWRKRFADQRLKIAKTQEELDVLEKELVKAQVQYYPDPQKAMNQGFSQTDVKDKTAKIEAKKQELQKLNSELDDLEEQLRRSGGDIGWSRP